MTSMVGITRALVAVCDAVNMIDSLDKSFNPGPVSVTSSLKHNASIPSFVLNTREDLIFLWEDSSFCPVFKKLNMRISMDYV